MFTVNSSLSVCGGMRLGQAVRQSTGEQTSDNSKHDKAASLRCHALAALCATPTSPMSLL